MSGKFDVYEIKRCSLLVGRLKGVLEAETAEQMIEFLETKELLADTGFNRFCDLTHLEGVRLSTMDLIRMAERRRDFNPNQFFVKSAWLAHDPLSFGIVRMYEQILNSPRIEVRVWSDMHAAADWLGVNVESLTF